VARTEGYRFDNVRLAPQNGLPKGQHLLAAHGEGLRTKVLRFTEDWLVRGGPSDCYAADFDVSAEGVGAIDAMETRGVTTIDEDGDGVDDLVEDWLAEHFAPVVYHGEKETNFPVTVDFWLARTNLSASGTDAGTRRIVAGPLEQRQLIGQVVPAKGGRQQIESSGTRSRGKATSFFLENVGPEFRAGEQSKPEDWVTYVHSYANRHGGITLQYWRAYAWNQAGLLGFDLSHGGDWEGIAVHLNASLAPEQVAYLQHAGIVYETGAVRWEGSHPLVWSEEGDHSSFPDPERGRIRSSRWIQQETWTGGGVTGWNGEWRGRSGGLVNLGEKTKPRNGQLFVKYSGLWGSPKRLFIMSGYWGPAFNETGAECSDGTPAYKSAIRYKAETNACGRIFLRAWCDAMSDAMALSTECYAALDLP